ncbi:MAG: hypothetical protein KKD39_03815 [Candidatus Altiarchaeota archaeon]|nr:hypothetical protein [Candidatus Altiarchaeota archaeon]
MGLLDLFKGSGSKSKRCSQCKTENKELTFSKTLDGVEHHFCSKECSRKYRIERKKKGKKPQTTGSSLPW